MLEVSGEEIGKLQKSLFIFMLLIFYSSAHLHVFGASNKVMAKFANRPQSLLDTRATPFMAMDALEHIL